MGAKSLAHEITFDFIYLYALLFYLFAPMYSRGRTITLVVPVRRLLKHGTAVLHTGRYVYYIVHYLLYHELQLLYYAYGVCIQLYDWYATLFVFTYEKNISRLGTLRSPIVLRTNFTGYYRFLENVIVWKSPLNVHCFSLQWKL